VATRAQQPGQISLSPRWSLKESRCRQLEAISLRSQLGEEAVLGESAGLELEARLATTYPTATGRLGKLAR
jgi:hypothetical protein